ncbi:putative damage-inducible protein DinB [Neobacillus niacini]|uniref:DinB family protein n=1 Tax=Neobacillus niacini TaxID=86668 RepID=UPI002789E0C5|nr:DinB family protein [Neobacillus niacini]MDQ1004700.1 putative damage-inducible protein DinB [Neobacillus niacini]
MIQRPTENEYPDYYQPYIKLVPNGDIVEILQENLLEVTNLFKGLSEEETNLRYATGKWSVKEVLGHIIDTERIMTYRLLRVSRGDQSPLAGFNETDYVEAAQTHNLSMEAILEDFKATRNAAITLIQNTPREAWANKGNANGMEITTRAIAYIIAGHEMHHRKIVEERYLKK